MVFQIRAVYSLSIQCVVWSVVLIIAAVVIACVMVDNVSYTPSYHLFTRIVLAE